MKSSTVVFLGIRHVGKADESEPQVTQGTIVTLMVHLAEYLAARSMATRFDLAIARTEDECLKSLSLRQRESNGPKPSVNQSLFDQLSKILEAGEESDDDGDADNPDDSFGQAVGEESLSPKHNVPDGLNEKFFWKS